MRQKISLYLLQALLIAICSGETRLEEMQREVDHILHEEAQLRDAALPEEGKEFRNSEEFKHLAQEIKNAALAEMHWMEKNGIDLASKLMHTVGGRTQTAKMLLQRYSVLVNLFASLPWPSLETSLMDSIPRQYLKGLMGSTNLYWRKEEVKHDEVDIVRLTCNPDLEPEVKFGKIKSPKELNWLLNRVIFKPDNYTASERRPDLPEKLKINLIRSLESIYLERSVFRQHMKIVFEYLCGHGVQHVRFGLMGLPDLYNATDSSDPVSILQVFNKLLMDFKGGQHHHARNHSRMECEHFTADIVVYGYAPAMNEDNMRKLYDKLELVPAGPLSDLIAGVDVVCTDMICDCVISNRCEKFSRVRIVKKIITHLTITPVATFL